MPTALELRPADLRRYIEAARRGPAEVQTGGQPEHEDLLRRAKEVAVVLRERFHVQRVVLFGSAAHAAWFESDSDVDLAVEGLAGDDYWEAWRLAEEVIGKLEVDLIDLETASPSLKAAVARQGVEL